MNPNVAYIGGNGRSGTSLVAKIVHHLGYNALNDAHVVKFESSPIVYFDSIQNVNIDATVRNIRRLNSAGLNWFWKSPIDLGCFSRWIFLFPNIKIILAMRDPHKIAQSSSSKEFLPVDCYYKYIAESFSVISSVIVQCPSPILVISYEDLIKDPLGSVDMIAKFLNAENKDPKDLVKLCFTKSYSNFLGKEVKFASDDILHDSRVASKNVFLPIITERLSMARNLVLDSYSIINNFQFTDEICNLSDDLISFGYDLTLVTFGDATNILKTIIDDFEKQVLMYSIDSSLEHLKVKHEAIVTLLRASNRLRSSVQARYLNLESLWSQNSLNSPRSTN